SAPTIYTHWAQENAPTVIAEALRADSTCFAQGFFAPLRLTMVARGRVFEDNPAPYRRTLCAALGTRSGAAHKVRRYRRYAYATQYQRANWLVSRKRRMPETVARPIARRRRFCRSRTAMTKSGRSGRTKRGMLMSGKTLLGARSGTIIG